ncbi:hypothetical protein PInf_004931 [Phytophthora infestans]|nr:hypothetical protein PInf_004850 [Phytophthora infestans]KAI9985557.1 hypothetical protein PInf_004931 [Phytophthora infestans]
MTGVTGKLPGAAALDKLSKSQTLDKISTRVKEMFTSNNQKATDKLFARLKVGTTDSKLYESAAYQTWANSVSKTYKKDPGSGEAAMLQTMISHYGDEALAKLLSEAQQVSKTRRVDERFETKQLDNWLATGRTADDVYGLLKLNVDMEGIFKNSLLKTWISFVDKLGKEDPYSLLLSKLVKHYGEYGLSNVLLRVKTDGSPFQVTESVQKALLSKWQNDGKTADDVFKLLKLNTDKGDELLESPALRTWMSYVALGKGDPYNLLLLKLTSRYDEEELTHMLVVAKSGIARNVEKAQLKSWLSKGKTAEDAFKLLRLNSEKGTTF